MSIKDTIKADLTTAMKARDEAVTSTLRMVLAAITNAEVAGDEAVDHVEVVLQHAIEAHNPAARDGNAGLWIRRAGKGCR